MRFEQHRLTAESVTFRHLDSTTARQTLVEIARAQWELWARPVTLDVSVSPVINDELRAELAAAQERIRELTRQRDDARELAIRAGAFEMTAGAEVVAKERSRQVGSEGYTAQHDEHHGSLPLVMGAVAYALDHVGWWPWGQDSFKPYGGRVRVLAKAGALIAAAIDVELARESHEADR